MSNNIARTFSKEIINGADSSNTNYIKDDWVAMDSSSQGDTRGIAWGKDKFVAGNNNGTIQYSTDGDNWTLATLPSVTGTGGYRGIAYSPDLDIWVAVSWAEVPAQLYSTDGITWTAATTTVVKNVQGAAWGNGYFVAPIYNQDDLNLYSTDGLNWFLNSTSTPDLLSFGISYSPTLNLWAVSGFDGIINTFTDPTGDWMERKDITGQFRSMVWSPKLEIFAVCAVTLETGIYTSSDGVTWTNRASGGTTAVDAIIWDESTEAFFAVEFGDTTVYVSYDGLDWTNTQTLPASNNWFQAAYSPTLRRSIVKSVTAAQSGAYMQNIKGNSVEKTSEGALMRVENLQMKIIISSYLVTQTGGGQSIPTSSTETITFSSNEEVSNGDNPPTFSGGTITINEDGVYLVTGFINIAGNAGGTRRQITLAITGYSTAVKRTSDQMTVTNRIEINDQFDLNATDTIVMQTFQNSGVSLTVSDAKLSATRIA